jgi:integrase
MQQIWGRHIGEIKLDKLRPHHVAAWHAELLDGGGEDGKPLSARTVGHCHRLLHRALQRAVSLEILSRNVASAVQAPRVTHDELEILDQADVRRSLDELRGHWIYPIAVLAVTTGMRRGEILALRWGDIDLRDNKVRVERSLEQTRAGVRVKATKTRAGVRTLPLAATAIDAIETQRKQQEAFREATEQGALGPGDYIFTGADMALLPPNNLSRDWARVLKQKGLRHVSFHSLRHTFASLLIAANIDILTVSRRLGHARPAVTLGTYGHLVHDTDAQVLAAIEAALPGVPQ